MMIKVILLVCILYNLLAMPAFAEDSNEKDKDKFTISTCGIETPYQIWENVSNVEYSIYGSIKIIKENITYIINKPCIKIEEHK